MIGKGFHLIYGTGARLHFAVDLKPSYALLSVFAPHSAEYPSKFSGAEEVPWAEFSKIYEGVTAETIGSGDVSNFANGVFIPDLPGTAEGGSYIGTSTMGTSGMIGYDEIVDYSILDILLNHEGMPMPWRNRFAQSKTEKVDFSFRFRAINQVSNGLVVFMPFATEDLTEARVELLCEQDPILLNGTFVTDRYPDADIPNDGIWFKQWFFSAQPLTPSLTVTAGGSVDIPFKLTWNKDGSDCARATRFKVEADAGYLPKTRAFTDANGQGMVRVQALGLQSGDRIKVKLNAEHYSSVGSFTVEVV